jgi:predicted ATP-grasp superfamily ATP-dependent carboligase
MPNVLAAMRVLGREHHLALCRSTKWQAMMKSRWCGELLDIRDPRLDLEGFVTDLESLSSSFDVMLPFGHVATVAASQYRDRLHLPMPTPDYGILRYGHDKALTMRVCGELGIPHPRTWPADHVPTRYPVVVKARKASGVARGVRYAQDPEELARSIREISSQRNIGTISEYNDPIIQEYVPGEIHDCVGIYQNGEPKAVMTQRRIETVPISGGPGAYNQTTREPDLLSLTTGLLDEIGWHGPFQAEWKLDPEGRYKLLELNPKMWGTMELAMRAGVDVPGMALQISLGEEVEPLQGYRVGVKQVWSFPLIWQNLVREPSLRRLGMLMADPVRLSDPKPGIFQIASSVALCLRGFPGSGVPAPPAATIQEELRP